VYRVWVTPQRVSVLEPNLTAPPFGRPADGVEVGRGFYVAVPPYDSHTLTVSVNEADWGHVEVEPNLARYPHGVEVTLVGVAEPDRSFHHWHLFDVNYPGDDNYGTQETANPLVLVMDEDREVRGVFSPASGCGSGLGEMGFLGMVGLVGMIALGRRSR